MGKKKKKIVAIFNWPYWSLEVLKYRELFKKVNHQVFLEPTLFLGHGAMKPDERQFVAEVQPVTWVLLLVPNSNHQVTPLLLVSVSTSIVWVWTPLPCTVELLESKSNGWERDLKNVHCYIVKCCIITSHGVYPQGTNCLVGKERPCWHGKESEENKRTCDQVWPLKL